MVRIDALKKPKTVDEAQALVEEAEEEVKRLKEAGSDEEETQPHPQILEREINLSLLNEKLNFIINLLQEK